PYDRISGSAFSDF
nr:RecName: Full=Lymna-DF-amide 3 [Lymnaea stagnalis]AAB26364.1 lymnaDFamide 3=neuropeptide homolog [Lymnaea stagnalis=snails, ganglia, Peptide, 13 aa] [Lymnaea stagnalis]